MPGLLGSLRGRGRRPGGKRSTPPRKRRPGRSRGTHSGDAKNRIDLEPADEPDFKRMLIYLMIIIIGILWNMNFNKRKMESKAGADFNPPPEL
mmetsp:Transcript_22899/g.33954  ORF Transcript_22899/g.33954 Transcript_22899/m.33954 type:complete len:93 (+) Transcript_22899:153-431(+)